MSCYTTPPLDVAGMTVLDKSKFKKCIQINAIKIENKHVFAFLKKAKSFVFKMLKYQPIQDCVENNLKLILLQPEKISKFEEFGNDIIEFFKTIDVTEKNWMTRIIELGYENWKADEIFKAVLPSSSSLSSFSIVGHIAHFNLQENHLPFKKLIGDVILDKNPRIKTVVNKIDSINSTFRNFQMELLAGENDMIAAVKENSCNFRFDFSQVYWNSRLGTEHQRIIDKLQASDVLYDVFAGVGPFAIPAAKKKCMVLANDLNPHSFHWLKENIKLNKITTEIQTFNMDGKDFILNVLKKDICERCKNTKSKFHIVMNLPALALDFIVYFHGLFNDCLDIMGNECLLIIHIYCFSKELDREVDVQNRLQEKLKTSLNKTSLEIFHVRNVAPFKEMMCASFEMPSEILFSLRQENKEDVTNEEPPLKKFCLADCLLSDDHT